MSEFKHHDLPVYELACGWHLGDDKHCGEGAVAVVRSRKWRYMALCGRHIRIWNRTKAAERLSHTPKREKANG